MSFLKGVTRETSPLPSAIPSKKKKKKRGDKLSNLRDKIESCEQQLERNPVFSLFLQKFGIENGVVSYRPRGSLRLIFYCIPARSARCTMLQNGARTDNALDSVNGSSYLPSFFDAVELCTSADTAGAYVQIRTLRIISQDASGAYV